MQAPFVRTRHGIDTLDHQLDLIVWPDGSWMFKDADRLAASVASGRFTAEEVACIDAEGARLAAMLETGSPWWSGRPDGVADSGARSRLAR